MSQGRSSPEHADSGKDSGPSRSPQPSPPIEVKLERNGEQTIIGFSGIGIDAGAIAVPDPDIDHQTARELAHDVVDAAGGVA